MPKSILDLDISDLEEILQTNELPEGVSLEGIESHKECVKLFRHRTTPKLIAQILLKDKTKSGESPELRSQRLEFRKLELEFKKEKLSNQTWMFKQISQKLKSLEVKLDYTVNELKELKRVINSLSKGGE